MQSDHPVRPTWEHAMFSQKDAIMQVMAQVQSHATEVGFFGLFPASLGVAPEGQSLVTDDPAREIGEDRS